MSSAPFIMCLFALVGFCVATVPAFRAASKHDKQVERTKHILQLEIKSGLGIFWVRDDLEALEPRLKRTRVPGYQTLEDYVFICYGCDKEIRYMTSGGGRIYGENAKLILCHTCSGELVSV